MLNFCSLYSGSSGNSLFVQTENSRILIDAGVSSKKIETALNGLEVDPASIDGILITHEHSDHVQGLGTFAKKFNIPVFVNSKTLDEYKQSSFGYNFRMLEIKTMTSFTNHQLKTINYDNLSRKLNKGSNR